MNKGYFIVMRVLWIGFIILTQSETWAVKKTCHFGDLLMLKINSSKFKPQRMRVMRTV